MLNQWKTKSSLGTKSIIITEFNPPSFSPSHITDYVLWPLPSQRYVYKGGIISTTDIIPYPGMGAPLTR